MSSLYLIDLLNLVESEKFNFLDFWYLFYFLLNPICQKSLKLLEGKRRENIRENSKTFEPLKNISQLLKKKKVFRDVQKKKIWRRIDKKHKNCIFQNCILFLLKTEINIIQ